MAFLESFFGAGTATAIAGYLAKTYISDRLERDMEALKTQLREQEEENKVRLAERASVRMVMKRYSRVVLVSAADIQDRLWHLCVRQAAAKEKVLLAKNDNEPMYSSWPMTRHHYLTSTMYMFSRYFCWVEILKRNVSFLEFSNDRETIEFSYHLKRIERMLAETNLQKQSVHRIASDKPVFQLMQTEIGECLRVSDGQADQCMSFRDYRKNYAQLRGECEGMVQLENLLVCAMSDDKGNFCLNRLKLTGNALADLICFLRRSNGLNDDVSIGRIPLSDFNDDEFAKLWPATVSHATSAISFR